MLIPLAIPVALAASTFANTPAEGNQRFHLRTEFLWIPVTKPGRSPPITPTWAFKPSRFGSEHHAAQRRGVVSSKTSHHTVTGRDPSHWRHLPSGDTRQWRQVRPPYNLRFQTFDIISYTFHAKHGCATYVRSDVSDAARVSSSQCCDVIRVGGYHIANVCKPPTEHWTPWKTV